MEKFKSFKEVVVNKHGLEVEVEAFYFESANQWCYDEYSARKMELYENSTELLPIEEEQRILSKYQRINHFKKFDA